MTYHKLEMLTKALKFFREKQDLIKQSEIDTLFDKITEADKKDIDELITYFEDEKDRLNKMREMG